MFCDDEHCDNPARHLSYVQTSKHKYLYIEFKWHHVG